MHHFRPFLHIGWGAPLSFLHHCPTNRVWHPYPLCPLSTIYTFTPRLLHPPLQIIIVILICPNFHSKRKFLLSFASPIQFNSSIHSHSLHSPCKISFSTLILTIHFVKQQISLSFASIVLSNSVF